MKTLKNYPDRVLPDRQAVTMDKPFLNAYSRLLIKTCHKRGAFAMGGMAAFIPSKDEERNNQVLNKVKADKSLEANNGHDGTWIAHPGLADTAMAVFNDILGSRKNQLEVMREQDAPITADQLLAPCDGERTEEGMRANIRVAVQYIEAWISGNGCVPIYGLMEDAATAEISRTSIWQWIHHQKTLSNGKAMIEAGAAAVHFEDQLASVKKCGHMGGKVLVPTQEAIQKLVAARLAADVTGVPTLLVARTDADAADLITSDCDPYDSEFITGERTSEGFFRTHAGIEQAISRGLAYAPYADLVWCETSTPDLELARRFAQAIHAKYPGKLLAYNCSPSFNWQKNLDDKTIASFQQQLSDMGYKFQFITLAGIHSMWFNMFDLANAYAQGEGMKHYVEKVQQPEFAAAKDGYTFVSHQQEVGTGYFDKVTTIIQGGTSSVTALTGSTEESQF
ncbi:isocitrate lyase [Escherichia coli]|nr:isocitrate lyase [Escherichia coli]